MSTWSPVEPLVLMPAGRPMSSHSAFTARATVTTSVNGASFGSRSRMHQSGVSSVPTRDDQMCRRIAAVGDVQKRSLVVAHEVIQLALRVLAPDGDGPHECLGVRRRVFLKEGLSIDAV